MNQINTASQIIILLISVSSLLLAILIWIFDRRARSNRYLTRLLLLLALDSFAVSRLCTASGAQAEPWLYVLSATTLSLGPALFLATMSLLRPASWSPSRLERWLWRFVHLLMFAPILLVFSDLLLGTHWLYAGFNLQTYQGGFIELDQYLLGTLAGPLRLLNHFVLIPATLILIAQTFWAKPAATPLLRQRARWLWIAHLVFLITQIGGHIIIDGSLAAITLTALTLIFTYSLMLLQSLISDDLLQQSLANVSLRPKLYTGLGASLIGLLLIGGITLYSSLSNQQLINRTLTRQRELADLASNINVNLLVIQNGAFEFYDTWTLTGFERDVTLGGFDYAKKVYLTPLRERIETVKKDIARIRQLNPDADTLATLEKIENNIQAYEESLLDLSTRMERLGYDTTGEMGQMKTAMRELEARLESKGLESLQKTLLQVKQYEDDFFLQADLGATRRTRDLVKQLQQEVAGAENPQLSATDKNELKSLLTYYDDHFLAAVAERSKLKESRAQLINQSDLTSVLTSQLFEQQQREFNETRIRLNVQQTNTTMIVMGMALLTLVVSTGIAYFIANQIIRPVRILGDTANQLADGRLNARAFVQSRDEIGTTANALNAMAGRLQEVLSGLEQQVLERTYALERRSAHLEASAQVAQAAASVLEGDRLMHQVVEVILERFELYYVGLFLVDEHQEWAQLRAGTGEAGRAMLSRGHRIRVGEGMIGWCIANAQPRIASRAETDEVRLVTPELPNTRSEAALPLRSRGQVLGALSVQSDRPNAFDKDILTVLETMADQVAVALENARLFVESQAAIEAQRRAYGEISREAWKQLLRDQSDLAFRRDEQGLANLSKDELPQALPADSLHEETADLEINLPLKIQGQTIGMIQACKPSDAANWGPDELDVLETVVNQLEVALESARLHQEAQSRAFRERLAREITEKVRAAPDVESIAQTAAQELVKALGGARGFVKFNPVISEDNGHTETTKS